MAEQDPFAASGGGAPCPTPKQATRRLRREWLGERFGRLVVIGRARNSPSGMSRFNDVVCDCGNETVAYGRNLRVGDSRSCGCLRRETAGDLFRTHGESHKTYLYTLWRKMRQRCSDPNAHNYRWYGARGITVCSEWAGSYAEFRDYILSNIGHRPMGMSLDRIDNSRGYEPGNVRWATQQQQVLNSRSSVNTGSGELHG